jgi:uncharacterized protein YidB (DUF937 family)
VHHLSNRDGGGGDDGDDAGPTNDGIVQELSQHTGQQPQDVLAELSKSLPDVVNKLTPDGRLPTESEAARWA